MAVIGNDPEAGRRKATAPAPAPPRRAEAVARSPA